MLRSDPMTRGADVYAQHCTKCHVLDGEGEQDAPDHTGFASRDWILGHDRSTRRPTTTSARPRSTT